MNQTNNLKLVDDQKNSRGETRERILSSTTALLPEIHPLVFTFDALAQHSGIPRAKIEFEFETKNDLFCAIIDRFADLLISSFEEANDPLKKPPMRLIGYLTNLGDNFGENLDLVYSFMVLAELNDQEIDRYRYKKIYRAYEVEQRRFESSVSMGKLPDNLQFSLFLSAIHFFATLSLERRTLNQKGDSDFKQILTAYTPIVADMLFSGYLALEFNMARNKYKFLNLDLKI